MTQHSTKQRRVSEVITEGELTGYRYGQTTVQHTGKPLFFVYRIDIPAFDKHYFGYTKAVFPMTHKVKSMLPKAHRDYWNYYTEITVMSVHEERLEAIIRLHRTLTASSSNGTDKCLNTRIPRLSDEDLGITQSSANNNLKFEEVFTATPLYGGPQRTLIGRQNVMKAGYNPRKIFAAIVHDEPYAQNKWTISKRYKQPLAQPKSRPNERFKIVWVGTHVDPSVKEKLYLCGKSHIKELGLCAKAIRDTLNSSTKHYAGYHWSQITREDYALLNNGIDACAEGE